MWTNVVLRPCSRPGLERSPDLSHGHRERHHTLCVRRGGQPTERQRFRYELSDLDLLKGPRNVMLSRGCPAEGPFARERPLVGPGPVGAQLETAPEPGGRGPRDDGAGLLRDPRTGPEELPAPGQAGERATGGGAALSADGSTAVLDSSSRAWCPTARIRSEMCSRAPRAEAQDTAPRPTAPARSTAGCPARSRRDGRPRGWPAECGRRATGPASRPRLSRPAHDCRCRAVGWSRYDEALTP